MWHTATTYDWHVFLPQHRVPAEHLWEAWKDLIHRFSHLLGGAGSFPKRCGLERLGRNQKPSKSYSSSDPGSTFYAKFGRTYCRPSVCTLKNCVLSNNVRTFTTFAAVFGGSRNINNFLSANIKKLKPPFRVWTTTEWVSVALSRDTAAGF